MSVMRLIIVSNRLPFTASMTEAGPQFTSSSGGLATGLASYLARASCQEAKTVDYIWFGWPGATISPEHQDLVKERGLAEFKVSPLFLAEESMQKFYHGFCNKTIWPLFHYFSSLAEYDENCWQEYREVNRLFADKLAEELRPGDIVWVHDYQLMLLPKLLRDRFPDVAIGFFLHIPFPSFELFRMLPAHWRRELIDGLLGSSLIGFHTHDYARHFLSCVLRTAGYEHQLGTLTLPDRIVKVDTFPMGIDFEKFAQAAASAQTDARVAELRARFHGRKVIFSVDRLDYTKGLLNRLRGYERFLKTHPEWHGKVSFVLSVAPSRTAVDTYQTMKEELERLVGKIVGAYGTVHWTPLIYEYANVGFDELVARYRACDVALVTPLRDGMNLVAKEFIASRPDQTGVLILSEMAGAAKEMAEALVINPFHIGDFATALNSALNMPPVEQVRRNQVIQERLRRYNVIRWGEDFIQSLCGTQRVEAAHRARSLTGRALKNLVNQFQNVRSRALLLDYDGTLVPFVDDPRFGGPDAELLHLLSLLSADTASKVLIVSGRPRSDLERWFGELPVGLIAEHGVWSRARGEGWRATKAVTPEWKERVRPILQLYVDRLPGAFLEEKEFSLAWHYRRADPDQASMRAKELLDDLSDYTRNIDVQVLEGDRVLEVRKTSVTKGTAAVDWLQANPSEFVLAIGDDWTDEDLFQALPPSAFSIRVGLAPTAARYFVGSPLAVRRLLSEFIATAENRPLARVPVQLDL
jgi:trehalose 6-phosphate synthase/phosphatase